MTVGLPSQEPPHFLSRGRRRLRVVAERPASLSAKHRRQIGNVERVARCRIQPNLEGRQALGQILARPGWRHVVQAPQEHEERDAGLPWRLDSVAHGMASNSLLERRGCVGWKRSDKSAITASVLGAFRRGAAEPRRRAGSRRRVRPARKVGPSIAAPPGPGVPASGRPYLWPPRGRRSARLG
jgi:hypothetical protein